MDQNSKIIACLTLGNAVTLISNVVKEVSNDNISDSVNGSKLSKQMIESIAYQRIASKLSNR